MQTTASQTLMSICVSWESCQNADSDPGVLGEGGDFVLLVPSYCCCYWSVGHIMSRKTVKRSTVLSSLVNIIAGLTRGLPVPYLSIFLDCKLSGDSTSFLPAPLYPVPGT